MRINKIALRGTLFFAALATFFLAPSSLAVTVSAIPDADTFVRASAPDDNYGGAGAMNVSGAEATNAAGQLNGVFESVARFPMSNAVVSLNNALGTTDWVLVRADLRVVEMSAPPSDIFNRGTGAFQIFWMPADGWSEGTGVPILPTTDGMTWKTLLALSNPATDISLGIFTNAATDTTQTFSLDVAPSLVSDVHSGGAVTLHFVPASPQIGFTFESRTFGSSNNWPTLQITALPNPHPHLEPLTISNSQAIVGFNTTSNWNYLLQSASNLTGPWSIALTTSAQPTNGHALFTETRSGSNRFFRLTATAN